MTFCLTSVANSVFKLDEDALDFILMLLSITRLLEWKSSLYQLLGGPTAALAWTSLTGRE